MLAGLRMSGIRAERAGYLVFGGHFEAFWKEMALLLELL
jgi:hypothetical protein